MAFLLRALVLSVFLSSVPWVAGSTFTLLLSLPNTSMPFSVGRIGAGALIAIDAVNRSPDLLAGQYTETLYSTYVIHNIYI
jgi:hypothetical protein